VTVYVESSAVLSWLLGASGGERVAHVLRDADAIVASDLTVLECERVLIRARTSGLITEAAAADQHAALARVSLHWTLLRVDSEVLDRCRHPFPIEPVRTLDAIHLASALTARAAVPRVAMVSLDQRIRENAVRLGFDVVP
jgi:predicted nucleic acid-binding protein